MASRLISSQQKTLALSQIEPGLLEVVRWDADVQMKSMASTKEYKITYKHADPGSASFERDQVIARFLPLEAIPGFPSRLTFEVPLKFDFSKLENVDSKNDDIHESAKFQSAQITLKEAPEDKKMVVQKIEFDRTFPIYFVNVRAGCEQKTQTGQFYYWCPNLASSEDPTTREAFLATVSPQDNDSYVVTVYFELENLDGLSKSGTSVWRAQYKRIK